MTHFLQVLTDKVYPRRLSLSGSPDSSPPKESEKTGRRPSIGNAQNSPPPANPVASKLLEAATTVSAHLPHAAPLANRGSPRWDGRDFSQLIRQFPSPTSLLLSKINTPDPVSFNQLQKLETLKSIVVKKANPTLIPMLRNIELEELTLKDMSEFSDADLINCNLYFFKVALTHLSLQNLSSIKGNGLKGLANFFRLTSFQVDSCSEFDDSGLQEICHFNGKLTTLSLKNLPKITDQGLLPLIQLIQTKKFPMLQTVVIENCPGIAQQTKEQLQKALQEVRKE